MKAKMTTNGEPPAHLEALVDRVVEAAADPVYDDRKDLWTRHLRMEKVSKAPVYVFLVGGVSPVWQELIPPDSLVCRDPLERAIELQLRQKLYKHDHIPDDEVLLPTVWVKAARPRMRVEAADSPNMRRMASVTPPSQYGGTYAEGVEAARIWGLPFQRTWTGDAGSAYKVEPAMRSDDDFERLHPPAYEVDGHATQLLVERATGLVDGRLPVKVATDELRTRPGEVMVDLLGIDAVMYGVIDRPDFVHRVMGFITDGVIAYHQAREAAGGIDVEESWVDRVHYEELPFDADPHRLSNTWSNINAQSLCGFSPEMYAEFVQPYHAKLASALGENRIYYHGCEDLTKKIPIIRQLPNLRRFHVSPWTDLGSAVEQLGSEFVLEVHSHPTDTIYVHTPTQMRESLERIMDIAGDCELDIYLEVHSAGGDPSVLTTWAQVAQEVTARHS